MIHTYQEILNNFPLQGPQLMARDESHGYEGVREAGQGGAEIQRQPV